MPSHARMTETGKLERRGRRAWDVSARRRPQKQPVGGLQAVLGAVKYRRRGLGAREATG